MYILTKEIRDEFIGGLRQEYARLLLSKRIGSVNDILFGARELYLSGTPFHNRGADRQMRMEDPSILEATLDPLCVKIWHYFFIEPEKKSQEEFDRFHEECCDTFIEIFSEAGIDHTYGNAQKYINMLFKYLSCYEDAEEFFSQKFKYCHLPLDRYTYNGYRIPFYREVVYNAKYGKDEKKFTAWSQLTKAEYLSINTDISSYIAKNPKTYNYYLEICHSLSLFLNISPLAEDYVLTPFEAEFFLWAIAKRCMKKNEDDKYIYSMAFVNEIKKML